MEPPGDQPAAPCLGRHDSQHPARVAPTFSPTSITCDTNTHTHTPPCSKGLVSKERLGELHAQDRARGLSEEQVQQLYVYHIDCELQAWPGLACEVCSAL